MKILCCAVRFLDSVSMNSTSLCFDSSFRGDQYSMPVTIFLAIIFGILIFTVVLGNLLVILAVVLNPTLKSVQNTLIASLAFADLCLGLFVIPFSMFKQLMGYWMFGPIFCDIHGVLDVFLCTASILTICMISIDRYHSITKPVKYMHVGAGYYKMSLTLSTIWILSALISLPQLFGWKKHPMQDQVLLSEIQKLNQNRSFNESMNKVGGRGKVKELIPYLEHMISPKCNVGCIL